MSNDWNLCDIKNVELLDEMENNRIPMSFIKILTHKEKNNWNLVQKYSIGNKLKIETDNYNR